MMRREFALPAVDLITSGAGEVKLFWWKVRMEHAAFCAERAGAAGQRGRDFPVDTKSDFPAMAAS